MPPIALHWLQTFSSPVPVGVTSGVCWPKGQLAPSQSVQLLNQNGRSCPLQSWPIGYWEDGSVKWLAIASVLGPEDGKRFSLQIGQSPDPPQAIRVEDSTEQIRVQWGNRSLQVPRKGPLLISTLTAGEDQICSGLEAMAIVERRSQSPGVLTTRRLELSGRVCEVKVEQSGPIRAVIRITGDHVGDKRVRLPFVVRLYLYAGLDCVRVVHSYIYDGCTNEDLLAGIGLRCMVPMRGAAPNRRVIFTLDNNRWWQEPVCLLPFTMHKSDPASTATQRTIQLENRTVEHPSDVHKVHTWNSYGLTQHHAEFFQLDKALDNESSRVRIRTGRHAGGLVGINDFTGGMAMQLREFWQLHPRALELDHAGQLDHPARLTAWFFSPHGPASDMRCYAPDDVRLPSLYEAMATSKPSPDPAFGHAHGIAHTSDMTLHLLPPVCAPEKLNQCLDTSDPAPLLVAEPQHYHECKVFGLWSLPDHSTPVSQILEKQHDDLLRFFLEEPERRGWNGYWNWGDLMHSFDAQRHTWRSDEGGYAWNNTECQPDIWFWMAFLRSGRADVFHMAAAMTCHSRDVDTYHAGSLRGLGTRHHVNHWGCACKEVRISMAGAKRFYYFLTADERTADVLDLITDAWPQEPAVVQTAPWWANICWNWYTAYERTGNRRYADKILRGIKDILSVHPPLLAGSHFILNPDTGALTFQQPQQHYSMNMHLPFGAPEIWFELAEAFNLETWRQALEHYGEFWSTESPINQIYQHKPRRPARASDIEFRLLAARFIAYTARRRHNPQLAQYAMNWLLEPELVLVEANDPTLVEPSLELHRLLWATHQTTRAAQWGLNLIECLALLPGGQLPADRGPNHACFQDSTNE